MRHRNLKVPGARAESTEAGSKDQIVDTVLVACGVTMAQETVPASAAPVRSGRGWHRSCPLRDWWRTRLRSGWFRPRGGGLRRGALAADDVDVPAQGDRGRAAEGLGEMTDDDALWRAGSITCTVSTGWPASGPLTAWPPNT